MRRWTDTWSEGSSDLTIGKRGSNCDRLKQGGDGNVQYAFADADYTKRAEPDEVIAKLEEISANELDIE